MNIKRFNKWNLLLEEEEAAARMPVAESYWLAKGKIGKKVSIYFHDDMDGIFTAIEMKKWLLNKGFEIVKYGILNYSDGWKYTTLDSTLINVVLDFANMPGDERDELVDYYLDHHGSFSEEQKAKYKDKPVQKIKSDSAYEAVCLALGTPQDDLVASVIKMIDAAKYDEYGVSWQRLLDFDLSEIKKSPKVRLEFAAAFNQFLKRSDTKTLISVVENCKDASIYAIYHVMSKVSPYHNVPKRGPNKGEMVDLRTDAEGRLKKMQKMTRGYDVGFEKMKKIYKSQQEFLQEFGNSRGIFMKGYQIIGKLAFVPTGTWANALRARSIIEKDFQDGIIPEEPDFILLQYGGTLQVCSYKKMNEIENLPVLKNGVVNDLGAYMNSILDNFKKHFGYYDPDTSTGQDEITVSGGHGGIGSISNVFGECPSTPISTKFNCVGSRFIDMFKNKIISDLSGVQFSINVKWGEKSESKMKEPEMDYKVIPASQVTKLDKYGNVLPF